MASCTGAPDPDPPHPSPPDEPKTAQQLNTPNISATIETAEMNSSVSDAAPSNPDEAAVPTTTKTPIGRKGRKRKRNNNNNNNGGQQQQHKNNNNKWCKQHNKIRQLHVQQQQQQQQQQHNNNKPDTENIPCPKNANNPNNRNKYGQKNVKSIFKGNAHRVHGGLGIGGIGGLGGGGSNGTNASSAAKFFLPNDKRLRKEMIIPPTKFLLGGNISDPLNLNSLQDEALNASMNAATPKSSPITTPPKIEVLIPPNMFDPLHLMDAVDSEKYEKLLISPLKRKIKHRNRKKKTKKRPDSPSSLSTTTETLVGVADDASEVFANTDDENCSIEEGCVGVRKRESLELRKEHNFAEKDKCSRDLRLDLSTDSSVASFSSGRKRKVSESTTCSSKNKARRIDSMDKIVSPVIPQPGGWKRPPLVLPVGAPRSRIRVSSTSISESELQAITDDLPTPDMPHDLSNAVPEVAATSNNAKTVATPSSQPEAVIPIPTAIQVTKKKLPETANYQYGNYNRYFGFNSLDEFSDVRLKIFLRNDFLFRGKDMLDIGCNVGHMTIAVAKKLQPKTIVGVDIDSHLIARARHNLSLYVKIPSQDKTEEPNQPETKPSSRKRSHHHSTSNIQQQATHIKRSGKAHKDDFYPISFPICYRGIPNVVPSLDQDSENTNTNADTITNTTTDTRTSTVTVNKPISSYEQFPHNVFFKTMNYATMDEAILNADTQQYDLILCLSLTKWLHLNYGDGGLKAAFRRMFNQLRPGGKLVLEAQNWASYKKKKKLTETIFNNYKSIEFFPNSFHEYLLSPEVGFSHSFTLGIPRHLGKGFRRPIQLYVKGDFTPSQIRWSDNYQPQTPSYDQYRDIYYDNNNRPVPYVNGYRGGNGSRSSVHITGTRSTPYRSTREGNYSQHQHPFTPVRGLPYTSQYYNPMETDSYLPSYDNEVQTRHYCFASPLYSTVWSPPSSGGRRSASNTPLFGSIRKVDDDQYATNARRHVYLSAGRQLDDASTSREMDDNSRSPQMQYLQYLNAAGNTPSGASGGASSSRELDLTGSSPRPHHVYVTQAAGNVGDNSSSPIQQYSGESSRSVEAEDEDCFVAGDTK